MVTILDKPAAAKNWASAEYARGKRERKVGAILHWMAGYLPGTTRMFQNPATGYSTSLGVGSRDGRGNGLEIHRYVPADGYAYGSYNEYADRLGESIEIENDINKPYPGKPTAEVHELVAQLLAHLCITENWPLIDGRRQLVLGDFPDHRYYRRTIPGFGVSFNVTTHRSMALKDCPGTTDVVGIVRRGNEILAGIDPAPPKREEEIEMGNPVYVERTDSAGRFNGEWMLVDPFAFGTELDEDGYPVTFEWPDGETAVRRGFRVTDSWDVASVWAGLYGRGEDHLPVKRSPDAYMAMQRWAIAANVEHEHYVLMLNGRS